MEEAVVGEEGIVLPMRVKLSHWGTCLVSKVVIFDDDNNDDMIKMNVMRRGMERKRRRKRCKKRLTYASE